MSKRDHETEKGFRVFWAVLMERNIPGTGANHLFNVSMMAGANGFTRISVPYMRVDWARNQVIRAFLDGSDDPNDLLIMLDCDHAHPQDILVKLASHPPEAGVVGALSFRRGPPYEPMMFIRAKDGALKAPAEWEPAAYEVDALGFSAGAFRRWVFAKMDKAGYPWPYFRFTYPEDAGYNKGEDIYFCECAQAAGIKLYCNTSIVTPHLGEYEIDDKLWFEQNSHEVTTVSYDDAIELCQEQEGHVRLPSIVTRVDA